MSRPLRLVVFDATQRKRAPRALGYSWQYGTHLYRALGRVDAALGARDFQQAFEWLATHEPERQIAELQFWGHGRYSEGLARGSAEAPEAALSSARSAPNTITCLTGSIPDGY
jgi:hypothetical protein